jgi:hypothetical protein
MARRVEMKLRGRLRRLFGNLGLKLLALVLAILFWFFIATGREAYRELDVPVELEGLPEGIDDNAPEPENARIRVAGKGRDLFGLRPSDFRAVINVRGKDAGAYTFELTPSDVIYSGGLDVSVEAILSQKTVIVKLERRIAKGVPVNVDFSGSPAAGYYLGLPEIEPSKATLYGSVTVLDKVRAVSVVVDAEGRDAPFAAEVPIRAPAGITLVGADEARVTVPVGRGERRSLSGVEVAVRGAKGGAYKVTPAEVSVTLEGEAGRLEAAGPVAAAIFPRGPGRYLVRVEAPDYVKVVAVTPREVEATPVAAAK